MAPSNQDFDTLVANARSEFGRTSVVQEDPGTDPRFEVYHAYMSVCSQKVRMVLHEKGVPYLSNEMAIVSGKGVFSEEFSIAENYRPGYVRLRSHGAGADRMSKLATGHTMRTSVDTEGFDACVVPTLVDLEKRQVVVDSSVIVEYIDREVSSGTPLIPSGPLEAEVRRQIKINDGIPMGGILYGFLKDDPRPDFMKAAMDGVYDNKKEALERLIEENKDDAELVRTYRAKIEKEMKGKTLYKNQEYLSGILKEFEELIRNLDLDLEKSSGPWICGDQYTMADVLWTVSLYRIHWLGHKGLWKDKPRVAEYAMRLYKRPSTQSAIIQFPNPMPPSPHTVDIPGEPKHQPGANA